MSTTFPGRRADPMRPAKLRIGDDWNAIRIIALSQASPLSPVGGGGSASDRRCQFPVSRAVARTNRGRQGSR